VMPAGILTVEQLATEDLSTRALTASEH
jgi:hypothetical protein